MRSFIRGLLWYHVSVVWLILVGFRPWPLGHRARKRQGPRRRGRRGVVRTHLQEADELLAAISGRPDRPSPWCAARAEQKERAEFRRWSRPGRRSCTRCRSERKSASSTSCVTISAVMPPCAPERRAGLLQLVARERFEMPKGSSSRACAFQGEGARDADALAQALRELGGILCIASPGPPPRDSTPRSAGARGGWRVENLVDTEQHVLKRR